VNIRNSEILSEIFVGTLAIRMVRTEKAAVLLSLEKPMPQGFFSELSFE